MKRAFKEIMQTHFWDFKPESLQSYRKLILGNIAGNIAFDSHKERTDNPFFINTIKGKQETTYVGNPRWMDFDDMQEEDTAIGVIRIEGPVLRNGDACSYGSKEHRDIIMQSAADKHVLGYLMMIDSPGGSSFAKYDYEQAIEYARSEGKVTVALIDGMADSAGYAVASMCDEIYFVNPHDEVGCIGTMCAMYTLKDGDVNTETQERYAEIYADGSPYKNLDYRNVAEGKYDEIKVSLNKLCEDFQAMVRKYRPNVTDDQMTGKTFEAGEVIGTMVDGQGSFDSCIARIQELAGISASSSSSVDSLQGNKQEEEEGQEFKILRSAAGISDRQHESFNNNNQKQSTSMESKNYPFIQEAAGVSALVADQEGGIYFVKEMADSLEASIAKSKQAESTLKAKLAEVLELNAAIEKMKKEHSDEIEKLKEKNKKEAEKADDALKETEKTLSGRIKELEKQLEEKESEIKSLSEASSQAPTPQDPPEDNRSGEEQGYKGFKNEPVSHNGMTWAEKAEAAKKREEELMQARRKR